MQNTKSAGQSERILAVLAFLFCGTMLIISGIYVYLAPQLPNTDSLRSVEFETPLQVFSSDEKLIAEFGEKHTAPVTYEEIPPLIIKAFLAAEDDQFFEHEGINYRGLARAVVELAQTGSIQSGGSTITMQVAKNYFLSSERTFSRKFTELLLAKRIEDSLTKQEIMTLYVNKIFLGHRAYGIGAAAKVYYSKPLKELNLAEIAMIAGLPKAPSRYNPVTNPKRSLLRRDWIVGRMLSLGYITQEEHDTAIKAPIGLDFRNMGREVNAPYLAEMVRTDLVDRFGESIYTSGYKVYTTVNSTRQNAAQTAVINGLLDYDQRHGWRGVEARNEPLEKFYNIGGLPAAKVSEVASDHIKALIRNGDEITIKWDQIKWARPYKSVNSMGPAPKKPSDVLAVGDIIRAQRLANGDWKLVQVPLVQGQLIALNPQDGAIEALVGGFDYTASKFNRTLQGWRQAGSTMKPFVYAKAIENGYGPGSSVNDAPISFGEGDKAWRPENSDGEFLGPITLREALYRSRNTVSIRLLQDVGVDAARDYMAPFGFPIDKLPRNLTLSLGSADVLPIHMATGYAAIANGGLRVTPYFIDRIVDLKGNEIFKAAPRRVCAECEAPASTPTETPAATEITNEGETITVTEPPVVATANYPTAKRIMSPRAAYHIHTILSDVIVRGTGRQALSLGRSDLAGKTGTTNEAKDAWFAGYNPALVAVSWVGFDEPAPLGRLEYGGKAALPIWSEFMGTALAGTPEIARAMPASVAAAIERAAAAEAAAAASDALYQSGETPPDNYFEPPQGLPEIAPENGPQVDPEDLF